MYKRILTSTISVPKGGLASTGIKGKKKNQKFLSVGRFYNVDENREMSPI
jgi:hypothetical protein